MNNNLRDSPDDAPPPYARAWSRVPQKTLAPVIIVITAIATVWGIIVGVAYLRDLSDEGETAKLKALDIVYAALCFLAAGLQAVGFVAGINQRLSLVKTYSRIALFNVLLLIGIGVLGLVFHIVAKTDLIAQCVLRNEGDLDDDGRPLTNTNVTDWCNGRWNRGIFWDVAWLIGLVIYALFSASIASAFYHQVKNPAFNRTQAPSSAYPMNPYGQEPPFAPPPFAPPPNEYGSYPPPQGGDYKNEPPQYNYGEQWNGPLADQKTPGFQETPTPQQQGFPISHPNDSTGTLRAVDFREDGDSGRPRRDNDNVV